MDLFEYLTARRESKQAEARKNESADRKKRIDKLTMEIYELAGEVVGMEYKIQTYQRVSHRLIYSNHSDIGKMQVEVSKKTGRLKALKLQLEGLKLEEMKSQPSWEWGKDD